MRLILRSAAALLLLSAPFWWAPGLIDRPWFALEGAILAAALALLPVHAQRRLSLPLALLCLLLLLLTLAESGVRAAFSRPLNLLMDWRLAGPLHDLLLRNFGNTAWALGIGAVLLLALACALLAWLLRGPQAQPRQALPVLLPLLLVAAWGQGRCLPLAETAVTQTARSLVTVREQREFERTLADDPVAAIADADLFADLAGVDVIVAFVESYGADVLDDPRHAPLIRGELADWSARFAAAGLSSASLRWLSPVQGGQSWLPQTTLLSGRWVDSALRYSLITGGGAATPGMLPRDFARAGHSSIAVRPANTLPWPEGDAFGYGRIVGAQAMGYRGPALNWVTMPDQFTWSFLQRSLRPPGQGARYIDVALISSHAPWTPILPVITDWERIGDGALFAEWAHSGERPEDLWKDPERVREHYARSLRYSLNVIGAWAERYVDEHTLLIAVGDHPAAPLVTGGERRAVPMHVISRNPLLVQRFIDAGFVPGNLPPALAPPPRMSEFRSWFADTFSRSRPRRGLSPAEQEHHVAPERHGQQGERQQ